MENKTKRFVGIIAGIMAFAFVLVFVIGLASKNNTEEVSEKTTEAVQLTSQSSEPQVEEIKNTLTLSFIGDCIIGSESGRENEGNFSYMAANGPHDYFFSQVKEVLSQDDFTIANMECVITDRDLEKTGKDYSPAFWYKAPTSSADILTLGSVEVASVVNNHTGDYGEEGYADTVEALKAEGLQVGENLTPLYIEKNGIKIGLLCCNLWSEYNVYYIEEALKEMQNKCEYKIVLFHGGTEAVHEPDNYKIDACRHLANSGLCDLIVGSHPHVLQPMEFVNGVPILYSLGNFCYSANNYPENKTVIFRVELKKTGQNITANTSLIPCYVYTGSINAFQPAIMPEGKDKEEVLAMMAVPVEKITTAPSTEKPTQAPTEAYIPPATDYVYTEEEDESQGVPVQY